MIRFANFEVDLRAGELRKDGSKVRLQVQPFLLLTVLLESAGEIVTRVELRKHLWPANTFVDFDHRLAVAVSKLRDALWDSVMDYSWTLGGRSAGRGRSVLLVEGCPNQCSVCWRCMARSQIPLD
jgi:hypothetical protein